MNENTTTASAMLTKRFHFTFQHRAKREAASAETIALKRNAPPMRKPRSPNSRRVPKTVENDDQHNKKSGADRR
ncbi:MAG: hypothetical protein IPK58_13230 [Acidobacteria bacterium]|nr:hypothetical protein [Acidobacteriota bacterium]